MNQFKHALLERLSHYYHYLVIRGQHQDSARFTSAELACTMRLDPSQVRKDLAAIEVHGQPQIGFDVVATAATLRVILGLDRPSRGVIIGAGRLGSALATHRPFRDFSLQVVAVFDNDAAKIDRPVGPFRVRSMTALPEIVCDSRARLAVLTVPGPSAQDVAEAAVEAGVHAIWNFAPAGLLLPDAVFVRNEHIAVGLGEIAYQLKGGGA